MSSISTKNQVTIPIAVLNETGLHAGEQVFMEAIGAGEVRLRRVSLDFEAALGALTDTYPTNYLDQLDTEDEQR